MTTDGVIERELPVKLTEPEKLEMGDEMAGCELTIAHLKKRMEPIKAEIKEHRERRAELATAIDSGEIERMVDCKWIEDIGQNVKRLVRQDTGDVVEDQALTADERQEGLDLDSDAPGDEDGDGEDDQGGDDGDESGD